MRWRRHKYTGSSSRDYNYSRSSNDFTDNVRRNHDEEAAGRERERLNRQTSMLRNAARRNRRNEHGNHDAAARQQFFDRVQDRNRAQRDSERSRKYNDLLPGNSRNSSNNFTDSMRRTHDEAAARREREIANRQRNALRSAARRNRRNEHGNHDAAARQQFFDRVQDHNRTQREIERERKARRRFSR